MSDTELPERSLFAEVEESVEGLGEPVTGDVEEAKVDEPEHNEDQEMILELLDERDRLRKKIDELEESNMWKMLGMLAMSTLYTCILIAVVDVKNNPEL